MKFLCICEGGNVRSRAMAYILHDLKGHEAIPIGCRWASPETMRLLCGWADRIIVMQPHMINAVPGEFHPKTTCVDVGPDSYGLGFNPSLLHQCAQGAERILSGG